MTATPPARIFLRVLLIVNLAFLVLLGLRVWTGRQTAEATAFAPRPSPLAQAPAFSFVDQTGARRTLASLQGRAWLVEFIYTRCPSQCPRMHERLQVLSRELPADLGFLSVTCDPAHDTPMILRDYARSLDARGRTWLLAAADQPAVDRLADGLLIGRSETPEMHSLRWVLIDRNGAVRGQYDSEDAEHLRRLVRDARRFA